MPFALCPPPSALFTPNPQPTTRNSQYASRNLISEDRRQIADAGYQIAWIDPSCNPFDLPAPSIERRLTLCSLPYAPCSIPQPPTHNTQPTTHNPHPATRHRALTILGSNVSRSPSPSRLNPSTAQAMARPGKIAIQGERFIYV